MSLKAGRDYEGPGILLDFEIWLITLTACEKMKNTVPQISRYIRTTGIICYNIALFKTDEASKQRVAGENPIDIVFKSQITRLKGFLRLSRQELSQSHLILL